MKESEIYGVILAAGESSRLGFPKQLLPFRNKTILGIVVENVLKSKLKKIYLVLGFKAQKIKKSLKSQIRSKKMKLLFNKNFKKGKATSIQLAIKKVPQSCQAIMFILGDKPRVDGKLINQLLKTFQHKKGLLTYPIYQTQRGNPVIFHRKLFPELLKLKGDYGGQKLIQKYWNSAARLKLKSWDSQFEVDTWEDYFKLLCQEK
ncbi:MAG: hypothetical protein A2145_00655 [candidate division Zixibacteria bacterium RBG_16_40_9]|nr:MAG: hypothetical protein A2145_00655 [candidate division Zixibacteria bacterium RBG_16_40_9]